MGFFDSSSSSSTSNAYDQSKKNVEGLAGGSIGVAASGSGSSVNLTLSDQGAIKAAFDAIKAKDAAGGAAYTDLLSTTSTALSGILGGIASTQNFIADTQNTAKGSLDSRTITIIGLSVAALIGLYLLKGKA